MSSFWLEHLAGAAVLIRNDSTKSPCSSHLAGDVVGCSELIEFSSEIRDSGPGPHHAPSQQQQERICNGSHFILLDDSMTEATSTGADLRGSPTYHTSHCRILDPAKAVLQAPELQRQPATAVIQHGVLAHSCIIPPVTPVQHYQRFGSKWQSCGMLETAGPVAQPQHQLHPKKTSDSWNSQAGQDSKQAVQVPETQQEVKQECMLGMAARRKVQAVRLQQQSSSAPQQDAVVGSRPEDAPAPAAMPGPALQGLVITTEPVLQPRQSSSKKRQLDFKILELQLRGKPAAMSEKMIREELGNNPDTSKALRRLTQEGKLMRTGKGGRSSPFSYVATQEAQLALQQLKDEQNID